MLTKDKIEQLIDELGDFLSQKGITEQLEIRFVGGTAVCLYGGESTLDIDFDFQCKDKIGVAVLLDEFFRLKGIPVDFSEDATRWWMVSVNRERFPSEVYSIKGQVTFKIAHPLEVLSKKLCRYYQKDLNDAVFLIKRFEISFDQLLTMVEYAIVDSPVSEQIFVFRRNIEDFLQNHSKALWKMPPEECLRALDDVWAEAILKKALKPSKVFLPGSRRKR